MRAREKCESTSDSCEVPRAAGPGSSHFNLYLVVGLALLLRALLPTFAYLYTRDITIFQSPDTKTYVVPAQELLAHHRFFAHGAPEIFRTPGYPVLLIPGLIAGHLQPVTILLQILLSCFTVYMVYRMAQLLFNSERVAIAAAALYAIEPLSVVYTGLILTETLFAALVMLWLYLLLRYLSRPTLRDLLLSGILLAASVYVRPVGYFLPVIIALGLLPWILLSAQQNKQRLIAHVAAFVIVSFGLTALWQLRNGEETGYFGFSGIAPIEMYFDKAASVLAAEYRVPYSEMQRRLGWLDDRAYFALHPEQKTWSTKQRLEYMNSEARRILLSSPLTYARIHAEGVARIILGPGASDFLKLFGLDPKGGNPLQKAVDIGLGRAVRLLFVEHPPVLWFIAVLLPMQLSLLTCACLVLFSKRLIRQPQIIAAIAVVAYFVTISGGPAAVSRFRHPAMPIICVLAGYGLCLMWDRVMELTPLKARHSLLCG
jgi:4-amino-4-deoxy-L-arabinose transferase-like glycosyltransferase